MVGCINGCEGVLSIVHKQVRLLFTVVVVVSFALFLTCSKQLQVVLNNGFLADLHQNEAWLKAGTE